MLFSMMLLISRSAVSNQSLELFQGFGSNTSEQKNNPHSGKRQIAREANPAERRAELENMSDENLSNWISNCLNTETLHALVEKYAPKKTLEKLLLKYPPNKTSKFTLHFIYVQVVSLYVPKKEVIDLLMEVIK